MNYEANEIANEIRLLRGGRLKHASFLIVEGRSDELFCKFYVVDANYCEVIPVNGRLNVIDVLTILAKDHFPCVLAIIDADFDVLRGITPDQVNLFFTDTHDLETMILKSEAFDKFLVGYGDTEKIVAVETAAGKSVREILLETGQWVGYLRWISLEERLHLTFEKLPFHHFVDSGTLSLYLDKLIETVIGFSKTKSKAEDSKRDILDLLNVADLKQKMLDKANSQYDLWHVCQGHDLVEILAIGMRQVFAELKSREAKADKLEKDLILIYEKRWFNETQLSLSLKHWEDHNLPFRVLSAVGSRYRGSDTPTG